VGKGKGPQGKTIAEISIFILGTRVQKCDSLGAMNSVGYIAHFQIFTVIMLLKMATDLINLEYSDLFEHGKLRESS